MPRFHRTHPPPKSRAKKRYGVFRPQVRKDFEQCCAYCLRHEDWAEGEDNFELDHFRPKSLFPEQLCDFYNLYYACHRCNHRKLDSWPSEEQMAHGIGFVDLCKDNFEAHFHAREDGVWEPLTDAARYTEKILRLNSPFMVQRRRLLRQYGYSLDKPNSYQPVNSTRRDPMRPEQTAQEEPSIAINLDHVPQRPLKTVPTNQQETAMDSETLFRIQVTNLLNSLEPAELNQIINNVGAKNYISDQGNPMQKVADLIQWASGKGKLQTVYTLAQEKAGV